jgi:hypothetical protein
VGRVVGNRRGIANKSAYVLSVPQLGSLTDGHAYLHQSILMYASEPVHIHIICDTSARLVIETRLERLKHPFYDVSVFFYELPWQSIQDRLDREGSIWSAHSAGAGTFIVWFNVTYVDTFCFV